MREAKHEYRHVLDECPDEGLSEEEAKVAVRALEAVKKRAKRRIDLYTTRRFLSVNERTGLITKLDGLHAEALKELRSRVAPVK